MALGDEVDEILRREVKSLPAYAKAQAAGGSGVAPPVEEMNRLLRGWSSRCSVHYTCSLAASRTWRTPKHLRGQLGHSLRTRVEA